MARKQNKYTGKDLLWILILIAGAWFFHTFGITGVIVLSAICALIYFFKSTPSKRADPASQNRSTVNESAPDIVKVTDATLNKFVSLPKEQVSPVESYVELVTDVSQNTANLTPRDSHAAQSRATFQAPPIAALSTDIDEISANSNSNASPIQAQKNNVIADDDLATFQITPELSKAKNSFAIPMAPTSSLTLPQPEDLRSVGKPRWIAKNEVIQVGHLTIKGGFVFYGLLSKLGKEADDIASLLDPSLPISNANDYSFRQMTYWPRYSQITPDARSAFLHWLATDRNGLNVDIGYVFLYFYGIEKRFFDLYPQLPKSTNDIQELLIECRRLHSVYSSLSKSFSSYIQTFLRLITYTTGSSADILNETTFEKKSGIAPLTLIQIQIAHTVNAHQEIAFPLVKQWLIFDPVFQLGPIAESQSSLFWHVFEVNFDLEFPSGVALTIGNESIKLTYQPASPPYAGIAQSTITIRNLKHAHIPDEVLQQMKGLIQSTNSTLESLKTTRKLTNQKQIDAVLLELPAIYWSASIHTLVHELASLCIHETNVIRGRDINLALKTPKGISNMGFANIVHYLQDQLSIGIIPSFTQFKTSPENNDCLVLYRIDRSSEDMPVQTKAVISVANALPMIELLALIAHANRTTNTNMFSTIQGIIDSWSNFKSSEISLFKGHARFYEQQKIASVSDIVKRIEQFSKKQLNDIRVFATHQFTVEKTSDSNAIKLLETFFLLINPLTAKPATLAIAKDDITDSEKKKKVVQSEPEPKASFTLDLKRISELQDESKKITSYLGEIFTQDPVDNPQTQTTISPVVSIELSTNSGSLPGLDDKHAKLLASLLEKIEWARSDVLQIAQGLGLMTDGAIEKINEAAFDAFDAPILEGDDPIEVNIDLMNSNSP